MRLSTADHLTKGRVGWNIVTSYLESGAKNIGQGGLRRHDNRYEVAEEYVEVLYKLFEGSWEEGAVVRDRNRGIFAHPEKVHEIGHKGKYFEVPGYHLSEPSSQRTPVLYQAGASGPGKSFAARNAECVFVGAQSKRLLKAYVEDVRAKAAAAGRLPRGDTKNSPLVFDRSSAKSAEGAVQRQHDRALPFDPIRWLKDARFGAVRAPRESVDTAPLYRNCSPC